ncbi:hypothetical protein IV203_031512 [Nitzschia inconspicua]|uniref:Uncharacterized protein n=1 Tax=Nitzschia inconspicua TaxID=303405 RepID=A0A9K3LVG0_9STRA|nr:hypothetical protein IV203_031512 [Nitzschia inconspicua]
MDHHYSVEKPYKMNTSHTASTKEDLTETWDDSSIDTEEDEITDEQIYTVRVSTDKIQKASDLRCYKETNSYKRWFHDHVTSNSDVICATSKVAELCGVRIKIYYRAVDEERERRRKRRNSRNELPVNKVATLLTFDPNTGLYDHLIRGKAYILADDGHTKISKRTVWMLQELISEYKGIYHKYGADFSREGQMELLKACVQFKKGKWMPRSVYGMALTSTPDDKIASRNRGYHEEVEGSLRGKEDREDEGTMTPSSASHWFISTHVIEDMKDAVGATAL